MPNCAVAGCDYTLSSKDGTYQSFKLPKEPKLRAKWLKMLNRGNFQPTENTCICHRHFEDSDFLTAEENLTKRGKPRDRKTLKPLAYPTLFMNPKSFDVFKPQILKKSITPKVTSIHLII